LGQLKKVQINFNFYISMGDILFSLTWLLVNLFLSSNKKEQIKFTFFYSIRLDFSFFTEGIILTNNNKKIEFSIRGLFIYLLGIN
jgi:hypothetical protein